MQSPDVLRFFARSKDAPPGKGVGERVKDPGQYELLARTPNWRHVLSNFHVAPFQYGGLTYRSVEHAFQAAKIALVDPHAAKQFSVESGTVLGERGDGLDARKHRKMVVLSPTDIARWDSCSQEVMAQIAEAKYAQCPQAREVLEATRDAQLWHAAPRMAPVRFHHLERIRACA